LTKIKTDYEQQTWKNLPIFSSLIVRDVAPLILGKKKKFKYPTVSILQKLLNLRVFSTPARILHNPRASYLCHDPYKTGLLIEKLIVREIVKNQHTVVRLFRNLTGIAPVNLRTSIDGGVVCHLEVSSICSHRMGEEVLDRRPHVRAWFLGLPRACSSRFCTFLLV